MRAVSVHSTDPMPFVVRSDSENEAELVFLSPDEEPVERPAKQNTEDQGASPVLRRSNRKRKSVSQVQDMSKGSGSKKKRTSPVSKKQTENMPKIPRTPQGQGQGPGEEPASAAGEKDKGGNEEAVPPAQTQAAALEALLAGMESRLGNKIDSTNSRVEKALELVEDLEAKVVATENNIEKRLGAVEAKLEEKLNGQVKDMVLNQLREAGFDPDLTAGALTTIQSVQSLQTPRPGTSTSTYAAAAGRRNEPERATRMTKEDKQEMRFWECRRSLRLWPIPGATLSSLSAYLSENLGMSDVELDPAEVHIKRVIERKPRYKDEAIVTFEDKALRDAIKAQAHRLADHRDEAGMRLHIPDHLQKVFRALMNLSYELKKKNPELKRSVKFDEDNLSLFMDIQSKPSSDWRRVDCAQALKFNEGRRTTTVSALGADELDDLLDGGGT